MKVCYPTLMKTGDVWEFDIRTKKGATLSLVERDNHLLPYAPTLPPQALYFNVFLPGKAPKNMMLRFNTAESLYLTGFEVQEAYHGTHVYALNSLPGVGVLKELEKAGYLKIRSKIKFKKEVKM